MNFSIRSALTGCKLGQLSSRRTKSLSLIGSSLELCSWQKSGFEASCAARVRWPSAILFTRDLHTRYHVACAPRSKQLYGVDVRRSTDATGCRSSLACCNIWLNHPGLVCHDLASPGPGVARARTDVRTAAVIYACICVTHMLCSCFRVISCILQITLQTFLCLIATCTGSFMALDAQHVPKLPGNLECVTGECGEH